MPVRSRAEGQEPQIMGGQELAGPKDLMWIVQPHNVEANPWRPVAYRSSPRNRDGIPGHALQA